VDEASGGRWTAVVGRESELAAVAELLGAGPDDGLRVLVVTGPPGSGKSTLVGATLRRASDLAMRVLLARPREPEQPLAFSVLADLLEGVPAVDAAGPAEVGGARLPPPQHAALRRALGLELPRPGEDTDPRLVAAAVRAVLTGTATEGRLLLAVDDAHWADDSSLLVISHALHRARDAALSVLVAARPRPGADLWPTGAGRADVDLGPLSEAALFHLVRDRLGRTLGRGDLRRLVQVSRGNPMYALELAGLGGPDHSGSWADDPLPPTLEGLVAGSVRELPSPTRRLLVAAALAHDPRLDVVAQAAGPPVAADPAALDAAVSAAAAVATVEGGRLRFCHPLHAAAVVGDSAPEARREIHARLAELETGDEVTARHQAMAAVGPDAAIARRLFEVASRARGRGARAAARDLAGLAVAATPADDPAGPGRRLQLAGWALHDGDPQTCAELAGPLATGQGPDAARAHVLLATRAAVAEGVDEVVRHSRAALAAAEGDPLLRAAALVAWADGAAGMEEAAGHARAALAELATVAQPAEPTEPAEPADGDEPADVDAPVDGDEAERLRARALALAAQADALRGAAGWPDELAAAAALEERFPPDLVVNGARFAQAQQLLFSSRLDAGRELFTALLAESRTRGDEVSEPMILLNLGHLELRAGQLDTSGRLAREALAIAEVTGNTLAQALAELQVAADETRTGEWASSDERIRVATAMTDQVGDPFLLGIGSTILGRLLSTRGDHAGAVAALHAAARHAERAGLADPGWDPCPGDLAESLLALGRVDEAEAELARLAAAGAGLDRPHLEAVLPRLEAQLRAARAGPDDEARTLALTAVAAHERLGTTFELGRSLLVAGRLHRRAKQKRLAHELLGRAVAVFEANPAPVWAERARDELRRVGLRPSAPDGLTSTEARVAALAAAGRTNREIAAEVFASPKTVEAVLSRVYRKLGVRSRVELVAVLPAPPSP
jgi:DNA-binding CsgD family transcriptional regulator